MTRVPVACVVLGALGALVVLAGCGSESLPEPGSIAYSAAPDGLGAWIYVMDAEGRNERRVNGTWGSDAPSWSPDGTRLAFSQATDCAELPACSRICILDLETRDNRCLTSARQRSESPAWSPDGEEIAFVRWDYATAGTFDIETDLYLIRIDGTDERPLTTARGEDASPEWSPKGDQIVFSSDRDDPARRDTDLYVIDADGRNIRVLTRSRFRDYEPAWSPDGKQIVFTRDSEAAVALPFDLWLTEADGSHAAMLVGTPTGESQATWSPNGKRIAFVCEASSGSDEVCLADASGGHRQVVTNHDGGLGGTSGPDWAPAPTLDA